MDNKKIPYLIYLEFASNLQLEMNVSLILEINQNRQLEMNIDLGNWSACDQICIAILIAILNYITAMQKEIKSISLINDANGLSEFADKSIKNFCNWFKMVLGISGLNGMIICGTKPVIRSDCSVSTVFSSAAEIPY